MLAVLLFGVLLGGVGMHVIQSESEPTVVETQGEESVEPDENVPQAEDDGYEPTRSDVTHPE